MKSKQGQDFILVRLDAEKIDSLEGMIGNAVRSAFEDRPSIPKGTRTENEEDGQ